MSSFYKDKPNKAGVTWKEMALNKDRWTFWKSIRDLDTKLLLLDILLDDSLWSFLDRWRDEIRKLKDKTEKK